MGYFLRMVLSKQELPQYLKQLRGSETMEKFGEKIGVSKQAVWQYENAVSVPSSDTLAHLGIAVAFSVAEPQIRPSKDKA